jgi:hypothetical protein
MPKLVFSRAFALASVVVVISCDGKGVAPPVGSFNLASDGFPATAAQGGGAVGTLLLNRVGGHSAPVTLAATGLPANVTATFGSTSTASPSTSLTFAVAAAAAPGSYPITITGNAAGSTEQTTQVTLDVVTPPATASVTMPFCGAPAWFAYKNEGYAWQSMTSANGTFTFDATAAPIVAYVQVVNTPSRNESVMTVLHATRAELTSQSTRDCAGPKTLTGSVSGAATGQSIRISMGARAVTSTAANPDFSLSAVADRVLDLVATKGTITNNNALQVVPDFLVLQRALNPAGGSSLGTLDFAGQGFAPTATQLTIANLTAGDFMNVGTTFWTNTNTYGVVHSFQPTASVNTLYSMPAAKFEAGDVQELFVETFQSGFFSGRYSIAYLGALADRTETMGPTLATPSSETISTAPYVRVKGVLPVQAEYPAAARFLYYQNGGFSADRLIYLAVTAGFLGATPSTNWEVKMPAFGSVSGLNNAWLPSTTNLEYQAEAYAGPSGVLFGGVPTSGDVVRVAYAVASTGAGPSGLVMSDLRGPARRRVQPGQYFRR